MTPITDSNCCGSEALTDHLRESRPAAMHCSTTSGKAREALEASELAIRIAIENEDGLDGGDGQVHIDIIKRVLTAIEEAGKPREERR